MNKILIIGAQNIDIFATTSQSYTLHDSNQASIHIAYGGVARNIAENVKRLSNEVSFITVFGDDHFSMQAQLSLKKLGISITESLFLKNYTNSVYLGVMDKFNDLYLGINDMKIVDKLTPDFFIDKAKYISSFDIIVIDNNLSLEAIEYLLSNYYNKTIVMDGVSTTKVKKIMNYLPFIDYLKVNRLELEQLSKKTDIVDQLVDLHFKGAHTLIVTSQEQEIYLSTKERTIKTKPIPVKRIVNTSGAGDAFLSGFIHGIIHNLNNKEKLSYAKKLAFITLLSKNSTNELLSLKEVKRING